MDNPCTSRKETVDTFLATDFDPNLSTFTDRLYTQIKFREKGEVMADFMITNKSTAPIYYKLLINPLYLYIKKFQHYIKV